METHEQKDLEKFIHQQLRKLPEHEAPSDLIANVFATLKERENLPWWRQPFSFWPKNTQALLIGALSVAFIGAVYLVQRPATALNSIGERASSFAWLGRALETLVNGVAVAFRSLPWQWLAAIAIVFFVMYAACLATGFALYRVTARQGAAAN